MCGVFQQYKGGAVMNNIILVFLAVLFFVTAPLAVFASGKTETATFAGGCFWCVQPVFDYLKGVKTNFAGYANGDGQKPSYEDYAENGYAEAVQVTFDPSQISYETLLENFWMQIDPTDAGGQFVHAAGDLFRRDYHAQDCPGLPAGAGLVTSCHENMPSDKAS